MHEVEASVIGRQAGKGVTFIHILIACAQFGIGLFQSNTLICFEVFNGLGFATGPNDYQAVECFDLAKPEMDFLPHTSGVTSCRVKFLILSFTVIVNIHLCVVRRFCCAFRLEAAFQVVTDIIFDGIVFQEKCFVVNVIDDEVEVTIPVEIGVSGAV